MKILFLIQKPQARGAEIFASRLGNELIKKGHEVKVISIFEGNYELPFSGRLIRLNRKPTARFSDLKGWKELNKIILDFQPDLVQAMGADTLKFIVFSKLLFRWKAKTVFYNGSMISSYIRSGLVKLFNQWLYNQVDAVVAVSQASRKDFEEIFRFKKPHKVIPVGIVRESDERILEPVENPTLIHIGGFTFEKNHAGLLRIFSKVLEKQSKAKLILIGDGPLRPEIENLAEKMNLNPSIIWKGSLRNPFSTIPPNAYLLLPSIIEGSPAVISEAFFNRIPVVAYATGGISELIQNGQTGWLIQKNKEEEFAELVLQLIDKGQKEIEFVLDQALDFARENFLIDKVGEKYEEFYRKILN